MGFVICTAGLANAHSNVSASFAGLDHATRILINSPSVLSRVSTGRTASRDMAVKTLCWVVQVQGKRNIMSLLSRLKPQVFVPLINASFPSEGPLSKVIKEDGSLDQLAKDLKVAGLDVAIKQPAAAGKSIEVQL